MRRRSSFICKLVILIFTVLFICEYLIYYAVISQCSWPELKEERADDSIQIDLEENKIPVKAMFIADVHLLGSVRGHWFDRLRREWQMYRSFRTAISLFEPEVVFILGDLFDKGWRCSDREFQNYIKRLKSVFRVNEKVKLFLIPGNHDTGFHYDTTPYLHERFMMELNTPPVQLITIRGNHFVLVNSMAMEGDGCFMCRPAQIELNKISRKLKCAKGIGKCKIYKKLIQEGRPIFLQHFPMYRDSDRECFEPDEAPEDIKKLEFHERWDCLSREASEMIYDMLNPKVIIGGHTHHGCHVIHRNDIHEYTIPSFNWRNKNNPSFLLGVFMPNNHAIKKCHIPQETTVIFIYCLGCFFLLLWILLYFKPGRNYYKLHRKFD